MTRGAAAVRGAALLAVLCARRAAAWAPTAAMGPLLPDTTALLVSGDGCLSQPGTSNAVCADVGVVPSADTCAATCAGVPWCSAMTWHGPSTGAWAGRCVLRKDGVWAPAPCGGGCDHVAANRSSGFSPGALTWAPARAGFASRVKPLWFGANASGLDSPDTLALLGAHAVAGYGWQQGGPASSAGAVGLGEAWQTAATTHLADHLRSVGNPNGTVVFQYRQTQIALRLFAQAALAEADPAKGGFWLRDAASGATCACPMPWGTSDLFWDFTNASVIDYWVDAIAGGLAADGSLTGGNGAVYLDEGDQGGCYNFQAGNCNFSLFNTTAQQEGYVALYARLVRALNAAGIVPIISLVNRLAGSSEGLPGAPAPCPLPQEALMEALAGTTWVRFYETWPGTFWQPISPDTDAAIIANAVLEAAAGLPTALHTSGACPAPLRNVTRPGRLGGDVEFAVASYLIAASPGTTLSLSNGWYDADFCWRPEWDVDYGLPLGPPVRSGAYAWARNFTRATAWVDVSQGRNGQVYLLA